MTPELYLLCILGMCLVTFTPRWLPLIWLSGREIPPLFVRWLRFVPASILSALVVPSILLDQAGNLSLIRPEFLVSLPTLAYAWWSRSLGGTVVVGMLLFYAAEKFMY
ncbi:MAG TPA: AzlD domain-containing protein [Deltaproteobacteria bacterium]|mgnify:CR=1 FL=1|nr:AzlD domain-containing protein [Deltaproteobacteria bacterium]HPR54167.1 AzlD domain-containing protein [Deltaproteobacteria bacterium]HXK45922.1 AzlD domain-containing protein [Deltaproteobacteria bacterium]